MVYFLRRAVFALVPLVLVAFAGCDLADGDASKFDHLTFGDVQGRPDKATLDQGGITLVTGYAVAATAIAYDSDDKKIGELTLHSDDADPLGVAPGPNNDTYVFFGRSSGTGSVRIRIDGNEVGKIPVTVSAQ